jgi:hypothetical protein
MLHDALRRCLSDLDIDGAIAVWAKVSPGQPPPATRQEVLIALHMARTAARSINMAKRVYSHCWLLDHGYPSQLPDILKPRAEWMYPRAVGGVGISVNSKYPQVQSAIHGVMREAVLEAYADGYQDDPETVKQRMQEARLRERKGLGL